MNCVFAHKYSQDTNANHLRPKPRREDFNSSNLTRQRGDYIEVIYFLPNDTFALFGAAVAPVETEMQQLVLWLVGTGLGVIVLGLAGGWWTPPRTAGASRCKASWVAGAPSRCDCRTIHEGAWTFLSAASRRAAWL